MTPCTYTVSELTQRIKNLLDGDPDLTNINVRGELSNYKIYPSGHHYFTIKDGDATLKAVMFRQAASRLRFQPQNGLKIIAFGRISVYPRDGAYQLYVNELTPDGVGDLHIAFEQLKEKLLREGLFDPSHKRPIPEFPERIAVITSSAGAAVRDIIRVSTKRYPLAKLMILSVRVQGAEAPPEIVSAIRYANQHRLADLIITGRGGGSIEDLWAFNDERVARAIYASEIPVISAVGHEPDVTISDFVSDLRAATPSNAAELAVPDREELLGNVSGLQTRLRQGIRNRLEGDRLRLKRLREHRVLSSPSVYVDDRRVALDHSTDRLIAAARGLLAARMLQLSGCAAKLDAMSPLKVLARGYAIPQRSDGHVLRRTADATPGEDLLLRISDGSLRCRILEAVSGQEDRDGNTGTRNDL